MPEHYEPNGETEPADINEPGTVFRDRLVEGSEGPEMVVLPTGSFLMGSPDSDEQAEDDEKPAHYVTIGYSFAVGRYPVTREEHHRFVESLKRREYRDYPWSAKRRRPAKGVGWYDAKAYVAWLSEQTGKQYRLLSEAEWEYACRAGTETRYNVGDEITAEDACIDHRGSTEVGSYLPNPWKLYDMHGNMWEWVEDCWHDSYYYMPYPGAPGDGGAWTTSEDHGDRRVLRGGSWQDITRHARSASRASRKTLDWASFASYQIGDIGFRIARTLDR